MKKCELHWLAGLFEGEGYIGMQGARKHLIFLVISMRDEDVIRRVNRLAGGYILGPYVPKNPNHSPIWRWCVTGKQARLLARKLIPLLGQRRSKRMKETLRRTRRELLISAENRRSLLRKYHAHRKMKRDSHGKWVSKPK